MDEPACPGCRELTKQVAELKAQVAELTRKLEESLRAGKRQAAPFRKGPPKPNPKTPGRKAGEQHGAHGHRPPPPPDQIHERHEAKLPDACPHCQGPIVETGTAEQFQTEIPRTPIHRQFHVHLGRCRCCGKAVQGRHPLQTSDALGAAASQIGPDAQAAATILHTQMGLSHGKVTAIFDSLFGIKLTRGASCQIGLRTADRLEPDYRIILDDLKSSKQIVPDESGWRIGGQPAWLHVGVGDRATHNVGDRATHNAVPKSFNESLGLATLEHLENQREAFDERLRKLASVPRVVPAYQRFANHLMNHFEQWFAFVFEPGIEPTNWQAEQAIRPAVVNRKVWGGNRTPAGAKAQSILMSVLETCRRQTHRILDYVSQSLRCFGNLLTPRPVLLPGR
jgi:transposase